MGRALAVSHARIHVMLQLSTCPYMGIYVWHVFCDVQRAPVKRPGPVSVAQHWQQMQALGPRKGNCYTCSDELQHMNQNSKLYTPLSAQGAPKCVLRADHLRIGGSEGCVHGVWLFKGMREGCSCHSET
jgi:hypothetical protein